MTDLPDGFRQTPLGPLPEEWEVASIGSLVEEKTLWIRNGYPQGSHSQDSRDGVPHLRPFNVTDRGNIDLSQIKFVRPPESDSPYWVRQGDVIFNNTNSEELVGKTAYFPLDGRFVLSNHMTVLRVLNSERIDAYWLAKELHYLWSKGFFQSLCRRHVNQASVSLARLSGVEIPLPPLPEQRAIAHVLRTVQQAREATERVIAAARELKRALMRHLFTYGPVPLAQADQVELQETEVGPVPERWKVVSLGEIQIVTQYGLSVRGEQQGQYPILRMNNLLDGRIDTSGLQYVDLSESDFQKFRLHKGDILFNRTNSYELVGKTALFDLNDDFVFASYLIRVVVNPAHCVPAFLNYYLNFEVTQARLKTLASRGVSQSNISASKLRGFAVPLPSMEEQREIARILGAVDAKIAAEEARREALDALFHTLLHHLMTGKVRAPVS